MSHSVQHMMAKSKGKSVCLQVPWDSVSMVVKSSTSPLVTLPKPRDIQAATSPNDRSTLENKNRSIRMAQRHLPHKAAHRISS